MAFQFGAFQSNAFQIIHQVANVGGKVGDKLRERLKRNTKVKAQADRLAAEYKKLLASQEQNLAQESPQRSEVRRIVKLYSVTKVEQKLPEEQAIDFEALARDAKLREEFLKAVSLLLRQEEEEFALLMLLAGL